jgi:release factor glutamine methyltransferase
VSLSLAAALSAAAARLAETNDTPRLDAELLAAHALNLSRSAMLLNLRDLSEPAAFAALIDRRVRGEPVAYITGEAEFWSLPLTVTPDTLIPRGDSETLIEEAQRLLAARPPMRILDLGTGSGALLLAALTVFPRAEGLGVDASIGAAQVAMQNAAALGLGGRAEVRCTDWYADGWVESLNRPFDLILCNPPYVATNSRDLAADVRAFEPASALFAGVDGLDDYRHLIPHLPLLLSENGIALFEIGFDQAESVAAIARNTKMSVRVVNDLSGHPRCVVTQQNPLRAAPRCWSPPCPL